MDKYNEWQDRWKCELTVSLGKMQVFVLVRENW